MLEKAMKAKRDRDTIDLRLRDTNYKEREPGEKYVVTMPIHFHALGICWGHSDVHMAHHSMHGFEFVISPAKHAGMIIGDHLLSVNDVPLSKKAKDGTETMPFQEMCQRVALSSNSPVRTFVVEGLRKDEYEKLVTTKVTFRLPQGHLGMNFDRNTLDIVSFQRVPGPAQLAIPRIGVGDVLELVNGKSLGTRRSTCTSASISAILEDVVDQQENQKNL
jgi:hypothetical protein